MAQKQFVVVFDKSILLWLYGNLLFCPPFRLLKHNLITLKTARSTATIFRAGSGGNGGAWPIAALSVDETTIIRGLKDTPYAKLAEKNLPPQF